MTDRYVQVDGLKTRYREEGSGLAVVLLHGGALGSSLEVYDQHMAPLAKRGLRVIAFDRPGSGRTEDPADTSAAFQRNFTLKFIDALGVDSAGLMAHSGTGGPSVQLAIEHPDRISRVLVLGTGSMLPPLGEAVGGPTPGEAGPEDREITRDDVRAILETQLYDHSLITPELIETRYEVSLGHRRGRSGAAGSQAVGGAAAQAAPLAPTAPAVPMWQRLGELKVPLRLVYGRDDRGSVPERVALLKERYPDLDILVLDRCKHLVQLDRADAFIEATGDFFAVR